MNVSTVFPSSPESIYPSQIRRFKNGTPSVSYQLFYETLSHVLGTYTSQNSNYNFPSSLFKIIGEYHQEMISIPASFLSSPSNTLGNEFVSSIGVGKEMWNHYFGDIGEVPPPPKDMGKILASPCPFIPGKRVEETHMLVLIPQTLNGTVLTIKRFGELISGLDLIQGKVGFDPRNLYFGYENTPFEKSHWVLMVKNVVSETCPYDFEGAMQVIAQKAPNYQAPSLSEAIVCIFMEYATKGIRLYSEPEPLCSYFTFCKEIANPNGHPAFRQQCRVGSFALKGLKVNSSISSYKEIRGGVIALAPLQSFS